MQEIISAYKMFEPDQRVRCIVMTGAGKMFCAGMDLEIGFPGGKAKDGSIKRPKETDQEHRDE